MNPARLGLCAALLAAGAWPGAAAAEALRFSLPEGDVLNEFHRDGAVAAHLVLTPGTRPRLVVAFPAGNSGAAIWFDARGSALAWQADVAIASAALRLADGSVLRGITAEISAGGGPIAVRQALLGSVRTIRDFGYSGTVPAGIEAAPRVEGSRVLWQRSRLDGAAGYLLLVEATEGSVATDRAQSVSFTPSGRGLLRLRVTALTGDEPLTPVAADELLTAAAAADPRLRHSLEFLSYREKLLAGSWRFNTYFGRDTLMSLRLLSPVATPLAMEIGLESVLRRLDGRGEVAHEEDIGEFAVLRRREAGLAAGDSPLFDYQMIDDDFMLAPVAAHCLLDRPDGRRRAADFLLRDAGSGTTNGAALASNLRFVLSAATRFAREPGWRNLVSLKPGRQAGNWRDSGSGLGGGRFPYDVNAVWVPAALIAADRLLRSGLLDAFLDADAREELSQAAGMAENWLREAPRLFDVAITPRRARQEIRALARALAVDPAPALASVPAEGLRFRAVALDARGRPVPVQNSDEAFALLFLDPAPQEVERIASALTRPFPAGLATEAGLLVANPAFAADRLQAAFGRNRYHGTVIWSWHQAMFAAGIRRQLERTDLTPAARAALVRADTYLRGAVESASALRGSELWSWEPAGGRIRPVAFGQNREHETESNAAQLWSTVHLARPAD